MSLALGDVRGEVFSTRSELSNQRLRVVLTGCLDMETAPDLERFLADATRVLTSEGVRDVEFELAGLYLMSSSSISITAAWIKRLKGVAPSCRVKFKTNPNLAWQRRTLESIRRVAESMVSVA
jgi:hypothetical protein